MTHDEYCIEICKAKCCKLWDNKKESYRCIKLSSDCRCSIYQQRFGPGSLINERIGEIVCGRIKNVLKKKQLPEWIESQCCYAHPELLHETGTNQA